MIVFRWVMGVIFALMGGISLLCFGVFIATGIDLWLQRARKFRRWAFAAALFWFNVWIWGTVIWTILHW
ncbi:MAG: hypothetical protein Q7T97_07715 [Burkholderiaceae bacterium]|nr:hypothetical protein [Burkholderiaceae bacterium]